MRNYEYYVPNFAHVASFRKREVLKSVSLKTDFLQLRISVNSFILFS